MDESAQTGSSEVCILSLWRYGKVRRSRIARALSAVTIDVSLPIQPSKPSYC